jgi:hypothetical protein
VWLPSFLHYMKTAGLRHSSHAGGKENAFRRRRTATAFVRSPRENAAYTGRLLVVAAEWLPRNPPSHCKGLSLLQSLQGGGFMATGEESQGDEAPASVAVNPLAQTRAWKSAEWVMGDTLEARTGIFQAGRESGSISHLLISRVFGPKSTLTWLTVRAYTTAAGRVLEAIELCAVAATCTGLLKMGHHNLVHAAYAIMPCVIIRTAMLDARVMVQLTTHFEFWFCM